jgi:patatin-like phospholipase/acyl hydrolase
MTNYAWTPEHPFQALALTGGGYRGLFTAHALQIIEEHCGTPIGRHFDLITGTSIGGIVALAAAFEIPMSKVVRTFEEYGETIFPAHSPRTSKIGAGWDLWKHARKPRHSADTLRNAITEILPPDVTLKDALHPLAIPAVNVTQGRPQVFKTRHKAEWSRDWKHKAVDVAMATSAAPTYFELAEVDGNLYADGGLFANAPDLIAIHEAEHFFGVHTDAIRLLSIGTTTKSYSISFGAGRRFGIADWMTENRLFSITIASQQQFVDQLVTHRLGNRYLRIDHEPSQEQSSDLGLNVATENARRTLKALASKAATDILGSTLMAYLAHTPTLEIVRS